MLKIIGLTGGIASGKNFIADIFAKKGAAVFDADLEVHKLLESDKSTIFKIKNFFPQAFENKKISRQILGKIVFSDPKKIKILEKIIHPQVRKKHAQFIKEAKKAGNKIIVLNIPLLLETKHYKTDYIIAVLVSKAVQKKRFLARAKRKNPKNFTKERKELAQRFEKIYAKQTKNSERKKQADFVVDNSSSKIKTTQQVKEIIKKLLG